MNTSTIKQSKKRSADLPGDFNCRFPLGIIGFSHSFNYRLNVDPKFFPFIKLKSQDEEDVEFALIDPWIIKRDYSFTISDGDLSLLKSGNPEDLMIFSIVTLYPREGNISLNLAAPIIINGKNGVAVQAVAEDMGLPVKYMVGLGEGFSLSEEGEE